VGVETIRFYEREELVSQPARPEVGFRRYPPETVKRVLFIQRSKALGFSLREIRELLSLRVDSAKSCNQVRKHAEAKIADIEGKIEALGEMRQALEKLVAACGSQSARGECPILEALEEGDPIHPSAKEPSKGDVCRPEAGRRSRIILWVVAVLVLGLLFLPYIIPYAFAGENGGSTATRQVTLSIQNMTCAACAVTVKKSLTRVDGVKDANVTSSPPQAVVTYDPTRVSVERLEDATTKTGFPSMIKQEGGKR
jgi:MerR family mercuric resistance operon transcriptional regulator